MNYTSKLVDLLRRAQQWLGDDISRRVPDFAEELRLREDIAICLNECMQYGCDRPIANQDHLPRGSWHCRCEKHAPPMTQGPQE